MSKKTNGSIFSAIRGVLIKASLLGLLVGGYFVWQNPKLIDEVMAKIGKTSSEAKPIALSQPASKAPDQDFSMILGKTTSLVEEGLQNLKVPKQLTGGQEEIVLEEVVDEFTSKIKNLPQEQIDRIKVQFCQDLLKTVENASVEVKTQ